MSELLVRPLAFICYLGVIYETSGLANHSIDARLWFKSIHQGQGQDSFAIAIFDIHGSASCPLVCRNGMGWWEDFGRLQRRAKYCPSAKYYI